VPESNAWAKNAEGRLCLGVAESAFFRPSELLGGSNSLGLCSCHPDRGSAGDASRIHAADTHCRNNREPETLSPNRDLPFFRTPPNQYLRRAR